MAVPTYRLSELMFPRPVARVMCGMCFACDIWPDLEEPIIDSDECRSCGASGALCGCPECMHGFDLLNEGIDIEQDLQDGESRLRIHAAEWTPYFGARKVTRL